MRGKIEALFEGLKDTVVRELSVADVGAVERLSVRLGVRLDEESKRSLIDGTGYSVGALRDRDLAGVFLARSNPEVEKRDERSAELLASIVSQEDPAGGITAVVLMTYLFEVLRHKGVQRLYTVVPAENHNLLRHLSALGFFSTATTERAGKPCVIMSLVLGDFESRLRLFPGALTLLDRERFESNLYEMVRQLGDAVSGIVEYLGESKGEKDAFTPSPSRQCPNNLTCNPGYCETQCIFPVCNIKCVSSCVACVNCLACIAPSACSSCLTSCMTNCVVCVSPGAGGGCTFSIKSGDKGEAATEKSMRQMGKRLNGE